jgi:hypothetical protein
MSDELCELLSQYPDSQRLAILVGDEGIPIGMNVGELTVLLARSEALYAYQDRLPVLWTLVFYEARGCNAPTTFKTEKEAVDYADRVNEPKPRVVPLFA